MAIKKEGVEGFYKMETMTTNKENGRRSFKGWTDTMGREKAEPLASNYLEDVVGLFNPRRSGVPPRIGFRPPFVFRGNKKKRPLWYKATRI